MMRPTRSLYPFEILSEIFFVKEKIRTSQYNEDNGFRKMDG
ncbi:hypothetical protein JOD24_003116 [Kroppenstedtia sanguinis]